MRRLKESREKGGAAPKRSPCRRCSSTLFIMNRAYSAASVICPCAVISESASGVVRCDRGRIVGRTHHLSPRKRSHSWIGAQTQCSSRLKPSRRSLADAGRRCRRSTLQYHARCSPPPEACIAAYPRKYGIGLRGFEAANTLSAPRGSWREGLLLALLLALLLCARTRGGWGWMCCWCG